MTVSRKIIKGVAASAASVKKPPVERLKTAATRTAPAVKKIPLKPKAAVATKSTKPALAVKTAKPTVKPAVAASEKSNAVATGSAAQQTKTQTIEKIKKPKLVRDSFTMPEAEYAALGEVKKACLKAGFEVKKSELLRIGVALVRKMALAVLKQEVGALAPLKPGRPPKQKLSASLR